MPLPVPSSPPDLTLPAGVTLSRGTPALRLGIARRLVSQSLPDRDAAAKRLVESAPAHRIDFNLAFATLGPTGDVRQAALPVRSPGRTAMLFISEPASKAEQATPASADEAARERAAAIDACRRNLAAEFPDQVRIIQALPEPREAWSLNAVTRAGLQHVGDLAYLRRTFTPLVRKAVQPPRWPAGFTIKPFSAYPATLRDAILVRLLDQTYVDTLDCPELCGLRETVDILASHKSTGVYDPADWFIVERDTQPVACMLLNRCPDQRVIELVYLGIVKSARGQGLGRALMDHAHKVFPADGYDSICCAVDKRNTPALTLYTRVGFRSFAERGAYVRTVAP